MDVLFLILKKKYYEQILSGEKTEEFREVTPYWIKRLSRNYDRIIFQEGYSGKKRIEAVYKGYKRKTIRHDHFGRKPVEVFAIQFKKMN